MGSLPIGRVHLLRGYSAQVRMTERTVNRKRAIQPLGKTEKSYLWPYRLR